MFLWQRAHRASSPNRLALEGQSTALIVVETSPPTQLFLENSGFFLKVFDNELLAVIYQACKADDQKVWGSYGGAFLHRCFVVSDSSKTASCI